MFLDAENQVISYLEYVDEVTTKYFSIWGGVKIAKTMTEKK